MGTPGRLLSLLQRGSLPTSRLALLVLDEADKLLGSESFRGDVGAILACLPQRKQVRWAAGLLCPTCLGLPSTLLEGSWLMLSGLPRPDFMYTCSSWVTPDLMDVINLDYRGLPACDPS